tara:strand:- start:334 stop:492 length:159 start_codon:yes stop_codon:yes gene_type:complete
VIQIFVFGFFYFFGWSKIIKAEATNKSAKKAKRIISPVINPKENKLFISEMV